VESPSRCGVRRERGLGGQSLDITGVGRGRGGDDEATFNEVVVTRQCADTTDSSPSMHPGQPAMRRDEAIELVEALKALQGREGRLGLTAHRNGKGEE
jgi:hypothetical protein